MKCRVNGKQVSEGNLGDMDWTFAEIIERASYGVDLYPGDVIGSGTVGTGCFLELNGTGKLNDPTHQEQWLQADDVVEMEIEGLGILTNHITAAESDWSILNKKKVDYIVTFFNLFGVALPLFFTFPRKESLTFNSLSAFTSALPTPVFSISIF